MGEIISEWIVRAIVDEVGVYAVLGWLFWDRVRGMSINKMQQDILTDIHQELGAIKDRLPRADA